MSREMVDTKNILDLSNIDSWDLIKELKSRGWYTNLIYTPSDVDMQLESINGDRDEEDGNIIVLEEDDKKEILDNCFNTDWFCERLNETLEEYILDNYDDESYYKKEEVKE
jgi:hypothetical protein